MQFTYFYNITNGLITQLVDIILRAIKKNYTMDWELRISLLADF